MFSHVTIGSNDVEKATEFYDAVMATLGQKRFYAAKNAVAYGEAASAKVWILTPFDGEPARAGNGAHIAFLAPSRQTVHAFHEAALAHGGSDEGQPGPRPHYHENYYAAYVRDPEGNKLQAVCHRAQ